MCSQASSELTTYLGRRSSQRSNTLLFVMQAHHR